MGNLNVALKYAKRGWRIFPLWPQKKVPATTHGFKDATTDTETIQKWWARNPNYGIGIATGDGLGVLDLDGPQGQEWLKSWESKHGRLPATLMVRTARGWHFYFEVPPKLKSRNGLFPGVDFKCDGGYVVAPPSIHPTGKVYKWSKRDLYEIR